MSVFVCFPDYAEECVCYLLALAGEDVSVVWSFLLGGGQVELHVLDFNDTLVFTFILTHKIKRQVFTYLEKHSHIEHIYHQVVFLNSSPVSSLRHKC